MAGARCDGNEKGFRVYHLGCVATSLGVFLCGLRNKEFSHLDRDFGSAWDHDDEGRRLAGEPARTASR